MKQIVGIASVVSISYNKRPRLVWQSHIHHELHAVLAQSERDHLVTPQMAQQTWRGADRWQTLRCDSTSDLLHERAAADRGNIAQRKKGVR
jgi:hypothetical protein